MKRTFLILFALVATVWMAGPAMGDTSFNFKIGIPNTDLTPYPSPYLDVTINLGSGTDTGKALFDVKSLTSGNYLYLFGGEDALGLNFKLSTGVTVTLSDFVGTHWDKSGAINQDSFNSATFGPMNQGVSVFDGYTRALKELTFKATLSSGSFNDAATVLENNTSAYFAAAHIFVQNTTNTTDAVKTGFAGNGAAPLPGAVLLLGAGLCRLAAYARRRKED
jgi:hypothetical protein